MVTETVMAVDIGTSSVRAMLFDTRGKAVPGALVHRSHHPALNEPGESTLDADSLIASALDCVRKLLNRSSHSVLGVGVSTFWHGMLGIDSSGRACTPVYLWSDTRSAAQVDELRRSLDQRAIHARTGCLFHTSYLPARLLWLRQTSPELFSRAVRWVSPGEYLYFRLFGEWRCSLSMASATGLLNQWTFAWDEELLHYLGLGAGALAPLADVDTPMKGIAPEYAGSLSRLASMPWFLPLGDGACSNVGSGGVDSEHVTIMVGTSGAMRLLGENQGDPPDGLWKYRLDRRRSLTGGALSNGGAVYQWMTAALQLPPAADLESELARAEPDGHGLTVLPFFLGERSPDWNSRATGSILGLSMATTPFQIFQASLEAVAYRFTMVHERLSPLADPGHVLVGSGAGLVHSPAWAQILTDAIGRPMLLMDEPEGSARGAALVVMEQLGILDRLSTAAPLESTRFNPDSVRHQTYRQAKARHEEAAALLTCYNEDRSAHGK